LHMTMVLNAIQMLSQLKRLVVCGGIYNNRPF
jgi:hypothetical protein